MSEFILGIDPGWSGGVAVLYASLGKLVRVDSFSGKTEADIVELVSGLVSTEEPCHPPESQNVCYIERVGAMPKQGVVSSFKFGWIYGILRGLVISRIRTIEVSPQVWQKALGCLTRGDKNVSKAAAQRLFPGVRVTHATADALLIAYYGYTRERGIQKLGEGK